MRSVSVANQKGGVGKTTITVALAAAAATAGANVLVVDADPQGHATVALGRGQLYSGEVPNLATVLMGETPSVGLAELIDLHVWRPEGRTDQLAGGRIDLLPSCPAMFLVEPRMTGERGREFRLARLIAAAGLAEHYQLCLIDCPPSLGVLTDNALMASREVLIVAGADPASAHGLSLLVSQVRSVREALAVEVTIAGLVVNRVEATNVSRDSIAAFGELGLPILASIPKRVRFQEAWRKGVPPQALEPGSEIAVEIAQTFAGLVDRLDIDLGVSR